MISTELPSSILISDLKKINDCCDLFYSLERNAIYNVFSGRIDDVDFEAIANANTLLGQGKGNVICRIDLNNLAFTTSSTDTARLTEYFKSLPASFIIEACLVSVTTEQHESFDLWGTYLTPLRTNLYLSKSKADIAAQRLASIM